MFEKEIKTMEENTQEVASQKRKYQKRKGEFGDMSIDQLKNLLSQTSAEIHKASSTVPCDTAVLNELTNKRVRIYSRMRLLGYSAKEVRSQAAAEKRSDEQSQQEVVEPTVPSV